MKKAINYIQNETLKIYKRKYSKKYIKENILPIINFINISGKNKFLIGGSQGIGKSSLIKIISGTLNKIYKKKVLSLSLDDYYLSKKQRLNLSKHKNKLLITRGVPGTHNIKKLIEDIKKFDKSKFPINTLLFDKLIDDVLKEKKIVKTKADILILEGWCCGCNEISIEYLYKNINKLEKNYDYNYSWRNYYNYKLKNEYKELFNLFDLSIFMKAPSFRYVYDWRYKQEIKNNSKSKNFKKMNTNEIKFFIQHFEKITKWMIKDLNKKANLVININKDQKIFSLKIN